ncbi:Flavodoxin/nitric oxide synthase [Ostreococcus tauri]|uniref:NAD(P)H dehydrogenase (quinone) n=1 Tax=Ostreococcus tauri TaxID=70448 RepID=A0A090MAT7_OSTTA|nr:Flavodoxin/nitric oxide synthase [Ostreococcus tauri]OUS48710.1 flavo protein WrbA [Ostreococcus tauri]CEF99234.1 Flavodoxin/nitric oxide synthase [Ostreococcus tauri]|eukprot:XP_022839718.1 Flavodoxin/nitric oxide synthase [Ostreococcus tauri]
MVFKVTVVVFSRTARLVTLANVVAEGARAVEGAEVRVLRVRDAIRGEEDAASYERGILDCAMASPEDILESDCVIVGAPTRHGRIASEMSAFFDRLALFHANGCALKGKIGSVFTEVGSAGQGYGGHEIALLSVHSFFLQHGMISVGVPPLPVLESAPHATVLGTTISAGVVRTVNAGLSRIRELNEEEVKLAYAQGEWASVIAKQLHDDGEVEV